MRKRDDTPFFVGYLPVPKALRLFLISLSLSLIAFVGVVAYALSISQADPGDGALRGDFGRQTVRGMVELAPAPVMHVTQGSERIPAGTSIMLSGQGKNGAIARARALEGQLVQASGTILQRGDLQMLQLRGGRNGLQAVQDQSDAVPLPEPEPLGRWRLAGEICDGKCVAGAMRPGQGVSHRACANLCIAGGIPPVFVSTGPVDGDEFLMIKGEGDDALPRALYDYVALYVSLEGDVARHGDLLILTVDADTVEVLR